VKENGNTDECYFYLPVSNTNSQNHLYISVLSASIPYTFYQVNSNNNRLYYYVETVPYTIVVSPGNYNVYTFISALKILMTGFNITYNAVTGKLTFTNTDNKNFIIYNSDMFRLLGLNTSASSLVSQSYVLVGDYPVNLLSTTCVCVYVDFRTGEYNVADTKNQQLLCTIPLDVAPFGLITYKNTNNYRCNTFMSNLDHVEIRITDQSGRVLDLNGSDWCMNFQIDLVDFVN
jgi:hypothetical protein